MIIYIINIQPPVVTQTCVVAVVHEAVNHRIHPGCGQGTHGMVSECSGWGLPSPGLEFENLDFNLKIMTLI